MAEWSGKQWDEWETEWKEKCEKARGIGESNAHYALDTVGDYNGDTIAAMASAATNVADTCREYGVSSLTNTAMLAFFRVLNEHHKLTHKRKG